MPERAEPIEHMTPAAIPHREPYESALRTIENALGIVQLRLSSDEWAQSQGRKMLAQATTANLLAHIATTAATLLAMVKEDGLDG